MTRIRIEAETVRCVSRVLILRKIIGRARGIYIRSSRRQVAAFFDWNGYRKDWGTLVLVIGIRARFYRFMHMSLQLGVLCCQILKYYFNV